MNRPLENEFSAEIGSPLQTDLVFKARFQSRSLCKFALERYESRPHGMETPTGLDVFWHEQGIYLRGFYDIFKAKSSSKPYRNRHVCR